MQELLAEEEQTQAKAAAKKSKKSKQKAKQQAPAPEAPLPETSDTIAAAANQPDQPDSDRMHALALEADAEPAHPTGKVATMPSLYVADAAAATSSHQLHTPDRDTIPTLSFGSASVAPPHFAPDALLTQQPSIASRDQISATVHMQPQMDVNKITLAPDADTAHDHMTPVPASGCSDAFTSTPSGAPSTAQQNAALHSLSFSSFSSDQLQLDSKAVSELTILLSCPLSKVHHSGTEAFLHCCINPQSL